LAIKLLLLLSLLLFKILIFEEIGQILKIRKNRNNIIREKNNIKNSVPGYVRYKQLKRYDHVRRMNEERLTNNFGMVSTWKKEKMKASNFMDAGSNNWNEKEGN
jgi:hypothetical protein